MITSFLQRVIASKGLLHLWIWAFCAATAISFFYVLHDGIVLLSRPYPTCITELSVLDGIQALARGRDLYPPFEGPTYAARIYNPLTYLPAFVVGRGDSFEFQLVVSRVVPFASMLLTVVIVFIHVKRQARAAGMGWAAGAFAVCLLCSYHSATFTDYFRNRPDMPALALSIAAWVVSRQRPVPWWPILAAVLAAAAIGFKQSALAAPAAIALHLLLSGARGELRRFMVTLVVLVGGLMIISSLLLGSGYFEHAFFAMASNPMHPVLRSAFFYPILVKDHWGALLPAALICAGWLAVSRKETSLLLYLLICLLWTTLAHGKLGADINYHAELSILMVIAVATGVARMSTAKPWLALAAMVLLSVFVGYQSIRHGYGSNRVCINRIAPTPNCERNNPPPFGAVAQHVRRLAELEAEGLLVLHDELAVRLDRVVALDWYMIDLLVESGFFKIRPLLEVVERGQPRRIVLPRRPTSKWQVKIFDIALSRGYRVIFSDRAIVVMKRPAKRAPI